MSIEGQLQRLIDDALAKERARIEARIHEAAERILDQRLAALTAQPELEGEWLDREQVVEQYGVHYSRIRDAQIQGKVPSIRRGKKVLSKREDLDTLFARAA